MEKYIRFMWQREICKKSTKYYILININNFVNIYICIILIIYCQFVLEKKDSQKSRIKQRNLREDCPKQDCISGDLYHIESFRLLLLYAQLHYKIVSLSVYIPRSNYLYRRNKISETSENGMFVIQVHNL